MVLAAALYWLCLAVFLWALVFAVVSDIRTLTVPNWTSILIFVCYLGSALATGTAPSAIAVHVAVGIGLLAVGALLFARGVMGGGDAKILAATGTWIGLDNLLVYLVIVAFAGGFLALAVLLSNRLGSRRNGESGSAPPADKEGIKAPVPYSVAIGIGAVAILFKLHEM